MVEGVRRLTGEVLLAHFILSPSSCLGSIGGGVAHTRDEKALVVMVRGQTGKHFIALCVDSGLEVLMLLLLVAIR